jgi:hypothetical protein
MALAGRVLLFFSPDEVRPGAGIIAYRGIKDENRLEMVRTGPRKVLDLLR